MSTRSIRKAGTATALIASGLVAGGVLAGSMTANADTATPSPSTSSSATAPRPSPDTPVTGTEADKVTAAVEAKHSGSTITEVRKDPDGSYDALGTDASGNPVMYDVSADLKTITAGVGRPGCGPGGGPHTAVTGTEADKVRAAVKAKDSTVTITQVQKDADGSYDALGTDASGNRVAYDVSADLKTVTARTGGPGGGHGPGGGPGPGGAPAGSAAAPTSASPSA